MRARRCPRAARTRHAGGALLAALLAAPACTAPDPAVDPATDPANPDAAGGVAAGARSAGEEAIGFWQSTLGRQWAFHCPFEPSCSTYGREAVATYGLLPGTLMITDRLMRDHSFALEQYGVTGDGRPLDPPASNALFEARAGGAALAPDDPHERARAPLAADEQLAFADRLFDEKEWERARIEYQRLLFHDPATPHAATCHAHSALCLAELARPRDALAELDLLPAGPERERLRALVLRADGRHEAAAAAADASDAAGRLFSGLLALEADQPERARDHFDHLDAILRDPLRQQVGAFEQLPSKSPWLAGALSAVLPGSGQLYAGRTADGAVAFVTNAVLIGGTIAAVRQKERVTAGALGFVAFGFWLGNVYGGVNAATHHDREQTDGFVARTRGWLRQSRLWIAVAPDGDGGALGIYLGF